MYISIERVEAECTSATKRQRELNGCRFEGENSRISQLIGLTVFGDIKSFE